MAMPMADTYEDAPELLFFDTFSHEVNEDLNLDLVQFPKPVYVTEVRIIPLGARVQADFPGGVRLGATNPSKFHIEFFVNDLGKPGASTFESLGNFEYNQNDCIHLNCDIKDVRQIPTDGLVLRGWYTTITLAVYGTLTKGITEQIPVQVPQPPPPVVVQQPVVPVPIVQPTVTVEKIEIPPVADWQPTQTEEIPIAVVQPPPQQPQSREEYAPRAFPEEFETPTFTSQSSSFYDSECSKKEVRPQPPQPPLPPQPPSSSSSSSKSHSVRKVDRRDRGNSSESDWDRDEEEELAAAAASSISTTRKLEARSPEPRSGSHHRATSRDISTRNYSRSSSRDRDYYNRSSKRDWSSRSPDYRHSRHSRSYDRKREKSPRDRRTPPDNKDYDCIGSSTKRPRTPPSNSPRRPPRTPPKPAASPCGSIDDNFKSKSDYHYDKGVAVAAAAVAGLKYHDKGQPIRVIDHSSAAAEIAAAITQQQSPSPAPTVLDSQAESPSGIDDDATSQGEPFEPILSDEEIGDELADGQFDLDYDDAGEFDEIFKPFVPGTSILEKYDFQLNEDVAVDDDDAAVYDDCREFNVVLRFLQRIELRGEPISITEFSNLSADGKEQWVHTSEHFIQLLLPIHCMKFIRRNELLTKIVTEHTNLLVAWIRVGLAFDCAVQQPQPGYKIRHIKIGARITELLCCHKQMMDILLYRENFDVFNELLLLYEQKYMALSIKLMLIKAIYSCLDSNVAMEHFLKQSNDNQQQTGYQKILIAIQYDPLTRVKFALKSLLKKVSLYETLQLIYDTVTSMFVNNADDEDSFSGNNVELLEMSLKQLLKAYTIDANSFTQPKRFLPVTAKFELVKDSAAMKCTECTFMAYFIDTSLIQSLFMLIANEHQLPQSLIDICLDMLSALIANESGLDLMMYNVDTINVLVKCLLNISEMADESVADGVEEKIVQSTNADEIIDGSAEEIDSRKHKLGTEISYKIKTKYCLDVIANIKYDSDIITDTLHTLFSLTSNQQARVYIANTININNNILILTNLIEKEKSLEIPTRLNSPPPTLSSTSAIQQQKCKSAAIGYAIDLIDITVRYSMNLTFLEEHGPILLDLIKSIDFYDSSIAIVLQEISIYLKPLEISNVFSYDNINALCELLKRSIDFITTFPGDLITVLRIIRYLAISADNNDNDSNNNSDTIQHIELKYKFVVLQLYSLDGITVLISILDKLTQHFEQPMLHTAALATTTGYLLTQIVRPTIELLRKMLTYVIQSLNTQFTDLLAIDSLLKVYNLMNHLPVKSAGYSDAKFIQMEIISTLLAYTQPTPIDGVDTESVHKSLWTQMIGECLKYTLTGPYTYTSGLIVLSELLPAPLPVYTLEKLSDTEISRLKTERQLWSAHLHPKSTQITEIIQTMCTTSDVQLLSALACLCVQLADLAPNMSLLVAKTLCDNLLQIGSNETITVSSPLSINNQQQQRRMLYFISTLLMHSQIKVAIMSILSGKLIDFLCTMLQQSDGTENMLDVHEHILEIFETLLDTSVSIVAHNNSDDKNNVEHLSNWYASALPSREILTIIANTLVDIVLQLDGKISLRCAAFRGLMDFTAVDYTFYLLRTILDKKKDQLAAVIEQLQTVSESITLLPLVNAFIDFIHHLITNQSSTNVQLQQRTLKFGIIDLTTILNGSNSDQSNSLQDLLTILETIDDTSIDLYREKLTNIIDQLEVAKKSGETVNEWSEPSFPLTSEGLVAIYNARLIDTRNDDYKSYQWSRKYFTEQFSNQKLTGTSTAADDRIVVDLNELIKTYLPAEMNIISECKRLLHLSASPQSNRERTTTAPCFRTRRVEVEPTTGRPEKKIYVTRGRGFPRTPPTRGDLFRSRPPNTSRPPSLHVDDFLALETCGAQPTGPTGYNKLARDMIGIRGTRGGRGRGGYGSERGRLSSGGPASGGYRQTNRRTNSPSTWQSHGGMDTSSASSQHFRTATSEPVSHFQGDYQQQHFSGQQQRVRIRGGQRAQRSFNR